MAMLEASSLGIPMAITDGIGGSAELVGAGAAILLRGDSLRGCAPANACAQRSLWPQGIE